MTSIQHMAKKVPFNYAFLLAKPCAKLCSMSNAAFTTADQHRLLSPIGDLWLFCQCNREVGPFSPTVIAALKMVYAVQFAMLSIESSKPAFLIF